MSEYTAPNVTPEKLYPIVRMADGEQLETLYRLAHHIIRRCIPAECAASVEDVSRIFREGSDRQRLLIYQVAYHLIRKDRPV